MGFRSWLKEIGRWLSKPFEKKDRGGSLRLPDPPQVRSGHWLSILIVFAGILIFLVVIASIAAIYIYPSEGSTDKTSDRWSLVIFWGALIWGFLLAAFIACMGLLQGWHIGKKPHLGEPQLLSDEAKKAASPASTSAPATKSTEEKGKQPDKTLKVKVRRGIPSFKVMVAAVIIALLLTYHFEPWLKQSESGKVLIALRNKTAENFKVRTAQAPLTDQYPNYSDEWCKDQTEDHTDDPSDSITIVAKEGCFHGWVTVPACWDTFGVRQSHKPGDYWRMWAEGSRYPLPLHPHYQSIEHDFDYFPGRGPTWVFRYEGRGTYELYRKTKRCDRWNH